MRAANLIFAVLFAFSTLVQYNDPDPLRWMALYGAAFVVCGAWDRGVLPRGVSAGVGVVAAVWGAITAVGIELTAAVGVALTDWRMQAGGSEELREAGGLALVAVWMAVLALRPRRVAR